MIDREQAIAIRALADVLVQRQDIIGKALVDTVRARLDELKASIPAAPIHYAAPEPTRVIVDVTPIAEALERIAAMQAETHSTLAELVKVLANPPKPVEQPRKNRVLRITHGDGTQSTIKEEW